MSLIVRAIQTVVGFFASVTSAAAAENVFHGLGNSIGKADPPGAPPSVSSPPIPLHAYDGSPPDESIGSASSIVSVHEMAAASAFRSGHADSTGAPAHDAAARCRPITAVPICKIDYRKHTPWLVHEGADPGGGAARIPRVANSHILPVTVMGTSRQYTRSNGKHLCRCAFTPSFDPSPESQP
jgi:hypothetical protein